MLLYIEDARIDSLLYSKLVCGVWCVVCGVRTVTVVITTTDHRSQITDRKSQIADHRGADCTDCTGKKPFQSTDVGVDKLLWHDSGVDKLL